MSKLSDFFGKSSDKSNFNDPNARPYTEVEEVLLERFLNYIKNDPRDALSYDGLASLYQQSGRLNEALAASEKAVSIEQRGEYLGRKGQILAQLGRHTEALLCFDTLIAKNEDYPSADPFFHKGEIYFDQKQLDKAIQMFLKAGELSTLHPEKTFACCTNLVACFALMGDLENAQKFLDISKQSHDYFQKYMRDKQSFESEAEQFYVDKKRRKSDN